MHRGGRTGPDDGRPRRCDSWVRYPGLRSIRLGRMSRPRYTLSSMVAALSQRTTREIAWTLPHAAGQHFLQGRNPPTALLRSIGRVRGQWRGPGGKKDSRTGGGDCSRHRPQRVDTDQGAAACRKLERLHREWKPPFTIRSMPAQPQHATACVLLWTTIVCGLAGPSGLRSCRGERHHPIGDRRRGCGQRPDTSGQELGTCASDGSASS